MKRLILGVFTLLALTLTSCEDDFFKRNFSRYLTPEIEQFIDSHYPKARIVDVDMEMQHTEVDIRDNGRFRSVYFNRDDQWLRTETDLRTRDLPKSVMRAIDDSEYRDYRIDNVEHIEAPEGIYYFIELEKWERDVYLKISTDGVILK